MFTFKLFSFWEKNEKEKDVIDISTFASSDVKEIEVNNEEAVKSEPKYGPLRRLSQKKEQLFLNFPALFSMAMILLTLAKLFIQIFDVLTDTMIGIIFSCPWKELLLIEPTPFWKTKKSLNSAFRLLWF